MLDIALLATMLVVCGGIGLPLAYVLPERFAWRPLVAPMLGVAVLSVLAPVCYRLGVAVQIFFYGCVVLGLASIALHARRLLRDVKAVPRQTFIAAGAAWLACTALLLAPRWVGGDQFSVFQGNPWDTFGYLESALAYARKPYSVVAHATDQQVARYLMFGIAQGQLGERPSVHLLYATFSRVAPGDAYRLYYPFLVFFLSQFFAVALFAVRSVLRNAPLAACLAIAAVFPLGFWGQYVLDINAWSQIAATPMLFLMFTLLLHAAAGASSLRLTSVLAVIIAGAVYLYPEGFIIYAAAGFPLAFAVPLIRMVRARRLDLRAWLPLASVAGIAVSLLYSPILNFLIKQVTWSTKARVPWWQFFQVFMQGRDGAWDSGAAQKTDFAAGIFGLYFATPSADASEAVALVQRVWIAVAILGVLVSLGLLLSTRVRVRGEPETESRVLLRIWTCTAFVMLLPVLYLFRASNYWPAGKVLSYVAPVLLTLLCTPIAFGFEDRRLRPLRWIAIAFVAFQLSTGVVRVVAARSPDGIHYAPPYPAVTNAGIKQEIPWDLRGLEPYLSTSTRVVIQPTHMWLEHGLMAFLFARRIPYARPGVVNSYFGDGKDLVAPAAAWKPDVEIFVEKRTFVLRFSDGRPDVRVVSEEDVR